MALRPFIIIVAALAVGCVGDSNQPNDAGSDVTTSDAAPDTSADSPPGTCVFGTSHFDDGCKFGP